MIPIALSFRHDRGGLLTPGLTARAWFSPPTYSWTMASSIAQTINAGLYIMEYAG